ncbi:hypothetical protein [Mycolicibacter minnesotensis]
MRYVAATVAGAVIGLAITAGLSYALARWGDCALADLDLRA